MPPRRPNPQSRMRRSWGHRSKFGRPRTPYGPSLARKICHRRVKGLPARFGDGRPAGDTSATLQRHFSDTSATLRRHDAPADDTSATRCAGRRHFGDTSATLQRHFSDTSATLRRHFGDTSAPRAGPGVRGRPRLLRGSTGPAPALFGAFRGLGTEVRRQNRQCGGLGRGRGGSGPVGSGLGGRGMPPLGTKP